MPAPDRSHLKLGKRPPRHDLRTLHLSDYLVPSKFPKAPPRVNYLKEVSSFAMLKNDEIGDCTIAGALHLNQVLDANTPGNPCFVPTDEMVLEGYQRICGYVPGDESTDNGGDLLTVLKAWRKDGIGGKKILGFAKVNLRSANDLRAAMHIFGGLYAGVGLPLSCQDQKLWDVGKGRAGEIYSWGGHCVDVHAYDARGVSCVTWGDVQRMTWAFFHRYFDEAYVIVSEDWLDRAGKTPTGMDMVSLMSDLEKVTT